ncbi:MAG TPA: hypothetical protein VEV15_08390, partial [Flavisolibacter sp.]|nr:hypothetical protein [Flavisolibacter sp.]
MLKSICIYSFLTAGLAALLFLTACQQKMAPSVADSSGTIVWGFEKTPMWADEFNIDGKLDSSKWGYDTGGSGWGNNELQYYTAGENVHIKNGLLSIEARKEERDG